MLGQEQLQMPMSTVFRPKQLFSNPPSDVEARITELEHENLGLRQAGFCKDREIRELKAELLKLGIRTSATHDKLFEASMKRIEAGVKRPRYDDDIGGPVMEP